MKNVLITGAGRGIGLAIAKALQKQDTRLFLVTKTKKSAKILKAKFPDAIIFSCDLTKEDEVNLLVQKIKRETIRLDVLINNAGFYLGKRFEEINPKEFDELYKIHLESPFMLMQGFLPMLRRSLYPQIINISSAANFARIPTESAYTAVKAGLTAMSNVLQKELQNTGVRITIIHPWTVNTHNLSRPENCLQPEDIADLISYIVNTSPNCQILNVELSAIGDWRGSWPPWVRK